jgi:hypothetical protein
MPLLAGKVVERRLLLMERFTAMLGPLPPHQFRDRLLAASLFVQIGDGVQNGPLRRRLALPNLLEQHGLRFETRPSRLQTTGGNCRSHPQLQRAAIIVGAAHGPPHFLFNLPALSLPLSKHQFAQPQFL